MSSQTIKQILVIIFGLGVLGLIYLFSIFFGSMDRCLDKSGAWYKHNKICDLQAIPDMKTSKIIIDNEFISRILENDFTISNLSNLYKPQTFKVSEVPNRYDKSKMDRQYSLNINNDKISIYKVDSKEIPLELIIRSINVTIDGNIKVGVSKSVFYEKFGIKDIPESFTVSDFEGHTKITFFFKNDLLIKIDFLNQYLD